MSMNPARTFGSALWAGKFRGLWIYFTAPPLGMLLAAQVFTHRYGLQRVVCAKLHHPMKGPCIFGCDAERQGLGLRDQGFVKNTEPTEKPSAHEGIEAA
jgi:hypothetical protein